MATLEGRLKDTISRDERTGIQHRMVRGFFRGMPGACHGEKRVDL